MMTLMAAPLVFVSMSIAVADDKNPVPLPEAARKELDRLQGQWHAKELGRRGKTVDVNDAKMTLEIKGNKWIFTGQEKGEIVAIDPKTDPLCLDIKSVEEGRKGQVDEAIFKIDGDTLTICLHQGKDSNAPPASKPPPSSRTPSWRSSSASRRSEIPAGRARIPRRRDDRR
jgi:uncharacterized protein (TIGR03067 family)